MRHRVPGMNVVWDGGHDGTFAGGTLPLSPSRHFVDLLIQAAGRGRERGRQGQRSGRAGRVKRKQASKDRQRYRVEVAVKR